MVGSMSQCICAFYMHHFIRTASTSTQDSLDKEIKEVHLMNTYAMSALVPAVMHGQQAIRGRFHVVYASTIQHTLTAE